ncbi:MAG: 2-isopropylmalate synthase, partial [Actinobacteria bacterium]|nr:2-isopropylmalate synthase [Actinomycetota bacterium]
SPESFTLTEPEFAIEICTAVMDVIRPTKDTPLILNLPATVECYSPNVYGDVIEWFIRNIPRRDTVCISLHPHNDRGCAVAAAEFGVMAGALAVAEERSLDAEYCNRLPVPERHPYVGDLVYTAFSGSHQDAIKKGFEALPADYDQWGVPYLPIDPKHVGRTYESVVRVNSQSGKGGVAYIMKTEHGFDLPRRLQIEFSQNIQHITEDSGTEISPAVMWEAFTNEYLPEVPTYNLVSHELRSDSATGHTQITAYIDVRGERKTFTGKGNGPIDAFVQAIRGEFGSDLDVKDYTEHALGQGSQATAVAYVETGDAKGNTRWGVGIDPNTITASLRAVLSGFERHGSR